MIVFKAFRSDLTCNLGKGIYQYQEGIVNREDKANCAKNGLHAAENPLDCLTYYPDWSKSVYYLCEAGGDIDEDACDSKISCTELTLIERLSLKRFVEEAVKYIIRHPERPYSTRSGYISVQREQGTAQRGGAVIIRGKRPYVSEEAGKVLQAIAETVECGSVVAVIREKSDSSAIEMAHIITDGSIAWEYRGGIYHER